MPHVLGPRKVKDTDKVLEGTALQVARHPLANPLDSSCPIVAPPRWAAGTGARDLAATPPPRLRVSPGRPPPPGSTPTLR